MKELVEQPSAAQIARGRLWVVTPRDIHAPDPRAPKLWAELAALGYQSVERRFVEIDLRLLTR